MYILFNTKGEFSGFTDRVSESLISLTLSDSAYNEMREMYEVGGYVFLLIDEEIKVFRWEEEELKFEKSFFS